MALARRSLAAIAATATFTFLFAASRDTRADRPPTPEERSRIEAALRAMGYERWDDIEFEDGMWEIDDARAADGRKYDLKLRAETLEVVERKED